MYRWLSGTISACHVLGPGSIPGRYTPFFVSLFALLDRYYLESRICMSEAALSCLESGFLRLLLTLIPRLIIMYLSLQPLRKPQDHPQNTP